MTQVMMTRMMMTKKLSRNLQQRRLRSAPMCSWGLRAMSYALHAMPSTSGTSAKHFLNVMAV